MTKILNFEKTKNQEKIRLTGDATKPVSDLHNNVTLHKSYNMSIVLTGDATKPVADRHNNVAPHKSINVPSYNMLSSSVIC